MYRLNLINQHRFESYHQYNKIYEIKGIKSKISDAKQLYNQDIIFLFRNDMKKYLDYVIDKYGMNFIDLYEKKDKGPFV